MKQFATLILLLSFSIPTYAQIVEFEDGNFKAYLIELGIDTNGDGEIQNSEAEAITSLHIEESGANSIVGIQSFSNLIEFSSADENYETIDVSNMAALESIEIDNESAPQKLIAQNCTSLTNLSAYTTQLDLESIDLTGCTALIELHLRPYFNNTTLILKDCINLETLLFESFTGIPNHEIDFSGCASLAQVTLHGDFDNIDVSGLISLTTLDISGNVSSFICEDMPGLEQLNIEGDFNNFSINDCPVLKSVDIMIWGLVDNISLNNFPELTHLHLDSGVTGSVIITNCQKLIDLYVFAGPVDTFDLSGCSALTQVNELSFIDANNLIFKNCISIVDLDLSNTITSQLLDLSGMISLTNITLFDAPETILLDGCYNLKTFDVSDFTWSRTLDFSSCISLEEVNLMSAYDLETLILKNGSNETLQILDPFSLSQICVDPDETLPIQSLLASLNIMDVNITSNCEFTNAGLPFQIVGRSLLDTNGDNCLTSSQPLPYTKYSIINPQGGEGYFFANNVGDYRFHLPEGDFTYKPEVLYGNDLFITTPIESSVAFPADGAEVIQDFCFTPGLPIDIIEVTLIPLEPARPGFDARYLITYTNTGNVTRGGDIKLDFQDDRMDLIDATPMVDIQEEGFLSWAFEDLIPYETRSIEFTMNLNSPMETPALNGGDIVEFEAMVGPLGNQTVTAYWSNLNQEIVNSFDPNDKTCLDGSILEPSMVGDYVKYMIRFENTGSAEAVNIVVTDSIDGSKFDISTLEILNSSHNVKVDIEENVVDFVFRDIYLPFEDATNDGYVTFKIKTWDNLVLGDDLRNKAEIYFDFNFPIITNTTSTVVMDPLSIEDNISSHITNEISPNPSGDFIEIKSSENISSIELFSIDGKPIRLFSYDDKKVSRRIRLQELITGHYFLKINNQKQYTIEKFIKL